MPNNRVSGNKAERKMEISSTIEHNRHIGIALE